MLSSKFPMEKLEMSFLKKELKKSKELLIEKLKQKKVDAGIQSEVQSLIKCYLLCQETEEMNDVLEHVAEPNKILAEVMDLVLQKRQAESKKTIGWESQNHFYLPLKRMITPKLYQLLIEKCGFDENQDINQHSLPIKVLKFQLENEDIVKCPLPQPPIFWLLNLYRQAIHSIKIKEKSFFVFNSSAERIEFLKLIQDFIIRGADPNLACALHNNNILLAKPLPEDILVLSDFDLHEQEIHFDKIQNKKESGEKEKLYIRDILSQYPHLKQEVTFFEGESYTTPLGFELGDNVNGDPSEDLALLEEMLSHPNVNFNEDREFYLSSFCSSSLEHFSLLHTYVPIEKRAKELAAIFKHIHDTEDDFDKDKHEEIILDINKAFHALLDSPIPFPFAQFGYQNLLEEYQKLKEIEKDSKLATPKSKILMDAIQFQLLTEGTSKLELEINKLGEKASKIKKIWHGATQEYRKRIKTIKKLREFHEKEIQCWFKEKKLDLDCTLTTPQKESNLLCLAVADNKKMVAQALMLTDEVRALEQKEQTATRLSIQKGHASIFYMLVYANQDRNESYMTNLFHYALEKKHYDNPNHRRLIIKTLLENPILAAPLSNSVLLEAIRNLFSEDKFVARILVRFLKTRIESLLTSIVKPGETLTDEMIYNNLHLGDYESHLYLSNWIKCENALARDDVLELTPSQKENLAEYCFYRGECSLSAEDQEKYYSRALEVIRSIPQPTLYDYLKQREYCTSINKIPAIDAKTVYSNTRRLADILRESVAFNSKGYNVFDIEEYFKLSAKIPLSHKRGFSKETNEVVRSMATYGKSLIDRFKSADELKEDQTHVGFDYSRYLSISIFYFLLIGSKDRTAQDEKDLDELLARYQTPIEDFKPLISALNGPFLKKHLSYHDLPPKEQEEMIIYANQALNEKRMSLTYSEAIRAESKSASQNAQQYQKAAAEGDLNSQYELAVCYKKGTGIPKDEKKAVEWCQKAASRGHIKAAILFSFWLQTGDAVEKDEKQALHYIRIAATAKDGTGQYELGYALLNGLGIEKDPTDAIKWLKKSAKQKNPRAILELGKCAERGLGISRDLQKAKKWYQQAAELKDAGAQYELYRCLKFGIGCEKNEKESISFCLAAAEQGLAPAEYEYGLSLWTGDNIAKNASLALHWWQKAAKQDFPAALTKLGIAYREGKAISKDLTAALEWFLKASLQGDAEADFYLGYLYKTGDGVTKDEKKAAEYLYNSAKKGIRNAQYLYGVMLREGKGVKLDQKESAEWFLKAAEQGHMGAQYNLGRCYELGVGVPEDKQNAFDCFLKAAKQGNAEAEYKIGCYYHEGIGIKKDLKEAAVWFRQSAEQGNAHAQNSYGCLLEGGVAPLDTTSPFSWYQKAASQGLVVAEINVARSLMMGQLCEKDEKQSIQILQKYVEVNPIAQYFFGVYLLRGQGIAADGKAAITYFLKAAEKNNALALNALGFCYEFGLSVDKNEEKAVECYQKAINLPDALFNLARCLELGRGIEQDEKKAYSFYEKLTANSKLTLPFLITLIKSIEEKLQKTMPQTVQEIFLASHTELSRELEKIKLFCRDAKENPVDCCQPIDYGNPSGNAFLQNLYAAKHLLDQNLNAAKELLKKSNLLVEKYNNFVDCLKEISSLFPKIVKLITAIKEQSEKLTPLLNELEENSKKPASFKVEEDYQRLEQLTEKFYLEIKGRPSKVELSDKEITKILADTTAFFNSLVDKHRQCEEYLDKIENTLKREREKTERVGSKKSAWEKAQEKKKQAKAQREEEVAARKKEQEEKNAAKKAGWMKQKAQPKKEERKTEEAPAQARKVGVEFVLGGDCKFDAPKGESKSVTDMPTKEETKPNPVLRTKFLDQAAKYCLFLAVTLNQFQLDRQHCKDKDERDCLELKLYYGMLYNLMRTVVAIRLYQHYGKTEQLPQDQLTDIRNKMMHGATSFISLDELTQTVKTMTTSIPQELIAANALSSTSKRAFARLKQTLSLSPVDEDKTQDFKLDQSPALQTVMAFDLKTKQEEKEQDKLNDSKFINLVWPLILEFKAIYKTLEKKTHEGWFKVMEYGHAEVHALKMIMTIIGEYTKLHDCGQEIAKECALELSSKQGWFYAFLKSCRIERGVTGHEFPKEQKGSTENADSIQAAYRFLIDRNRVERTQPVRVKEDFSKDMRSRKSGQYPHFHRSPAKITACGDAKSDTLNPTTTTIAKP